MNAVYLFSITSQEGSWSRYLIRLHRLHNCLNTHTTHARTHITYTHTHTSAHDTHTWLVHACLMHAWLGLTHTHTYTYICTHTHITCIYGDHWWILSLGLKSSIDSNPRPSLPLLRNKTISIGIGTEIGLLEPYDYGHWSML